jgi:hypothetical protein
MAKGASKQPRDEHNRFVRVNGVAGNTTVSDPAKPGSTSDDHGTTEQQQPAESIAGFNTFDPTTGNPDRGSGDSGTPRRGRGRPPGSKTKTHYPGSTPTPASEKKNNLSGLEGVLITIHMAAAKVLECPELQLAEEEGKALAQAVQRVNEQYTTQLNPKILAWMQLAMVAGSIYGTRIYAIRARQQSAAAGSPQARPVAPKNVVDIKTTKAPGDAGPTLEARTPADLYGLNYSAAIAHEM